MKALLAAALLGALNSCAGAAGHSGANVPAQRIVSLVPSLTEDLCAAGAARQLVGVSEYSRDIPCAANVPRVNDFASVDSEKIVRLHPDLVVAIPSQTGMTAAIRRLGIRIVFIPDDTYAQLFSAIAELGRLSGHAREAHVLIRRLQTRTARLRSQEHFRHAPSVFFVEQAMPLWTAGASSYIATLVRLAGGRLATASLQAPNAQYSAEALVRADPDAIVAGADAGLADVLSREPWRSLRAVREHHVFILKDSALLVRPGPRYNEGLSWLIERLRPLAK